MISNEVERSLQEEVFQYNSGHWETLKNEVCIFFSRERGLFGRDWVGKKDIRELWERDRTRKKKVTRKILWRRRKERGKLTDLGEDQKSTFRLFMLSRYAFYPPLSKFHEYACQCDLCPCLILSLDTLMFVCFPLIKCMLSDIIPKLTLVFCDSI